MLWPDSPRRQSLLAKAVELGVVRMTDFSLHEQPPLEAAHSVEGAAAKFLSACLSWEETTLSGAVANIVRIPVFSVLTTQSSLHPISRGCVAEGVTPLISNPLTLSLSSKYLAAWWEALISFSSREENHGRNWARRGPTFLAAPVMRTISTWAGREEKREQSWFKYHRRSPFLLKTSYIFHGQLLFLFSFPINILPVPKSAQENKFPLKHTNKTTIRNNSKVTGFGKERKKNKTEYSALPHPLGRHVSF